MALTMNVESMHHELSKMLTEHETYLASAWASIVTNTPKLMHYAIQQDKPSKIGSSNIYCYIGLTKEHLNIVTLHSLDVTRVTGYFHIPLCDIQSTEVKNGLLKSSATLNFKGEKLKLFWINQASGTNLKNQRKQVKILCEQLLQINEETR